jgi:hypothetical protein
LAINILEPAVGYTVGLALRADGRPSRLPRPDGARGILPSNTPDAARKNRQPLSRAPRTRHTRDFLPSPTQTQPRAEEKPPEKPHVLIHHPSTRRLRLRPTTGHHHHPTARRACLRGFRFAGTPQRPPPPPQSRARGSGRERRTHTAEPRARDRHHRAHQNSPTTNTRTSTARAHYHQHHHLKKRHDESVQPTRTALASGPHLSATSPR